MSIADFDFDFDFDYASPRSLVEAAALLASHPEARLLAGGQTLISSRATARRTGPTCGRTAPRAAT
jgi:CO/xanthine dehydrogenase FAD-binding subunit